LGRFKLGENDHYPPLITRERIRKFTLGNKMETRMTKMETK